MFELRWRPIDDMPAEVVRAKFLSFCIYAASVVVFALSATQITHIPIVIFNTLVIAHFVPPMIKCWIRQRSICPIELCVVILWTIGLLHGFGLLNWLVMPDGLIARNWVNFWS